MTVPAASAASASTIVRPLGERALLVEVDALASAVALHRRLAGAPLPGVVDLVPAARTVLVVFDPAVQSAARVRDWIAGSTASASASLPSARTVDVPIVYDGVDLAEAAALVGVSADALAARHSATPWTVAFTGFAPGFGYLVGDGWDVSVPRRASPRTRVPAGSVGLAGEFCGAYPRETPGGWQLIGSTPATLFDPDAVPPALLTPGTRVRFEPVRAAARAAALAAEPAPAAEPAGATSVPTGPRLRVTSPGLSATVQDEGRPGRASQGIARSGAVDRAAAALANRLVGNRPDAAVIEVTMGGFRAVAETSLEVVVTGAWGPLAIDGRPIDPYVVRPWPAGTELHVDWFTHGVRAYVAVRGGIEATDAVGSRSTDTLAGLGPAPIAAGDTLGAGRRVDGPVPALPLHPWGPPPQGVLEVPIVLGPRDDWFTPDARRLLLATVWTVSTDADRVGVRLDGPALERCRDDELPSEGMTPGAIQVPPTGRPVVLGVDGPVTGGYPVIGVVTDVGRARLAQAAPGAGLRFVRVVAP